MPSFLTTTNATISFATTSFITVKFHKEEKFNKLKDNYKFKKTRQIKHDS